MIEITLNGDRTVLSQPFSIRDLFDHLELDPHLVAFKVNRELVPLPHLAARCLRTRDIVEFVTLVGPEGLTQVLANDK
jgi:thiamine biosynthesis protein ThiS